MHPDKKVGLALGILLIGVTGAFFFRNEVPDAGPQAPVLSGAEELNEKIRLKPGSPYVPDEARRSDRNELSSVPQVAPGDLLPGAAPASRDPFTRTEPLPEPIALTPPAISTDVFPVPAPGRDPQFLDESGSQPPGPQSVKAAAAGGATARTPSAPPAVSTMQAGADGAVHEVVAGETLSNIAEKRLGSSRRFLELFEANRDILRSPDSLLPGMKLKLPGAAAKSPQSQSGAATAVNQPVPPASSDSAASTAKPAETPLPAGSGPSFVRPDRTPAAPVRRGLSRVGRSLSQTPPPDVPVVGDLDVLTNPAVLAARPGADGSASGEADRRETPPKPAAE